MPNANPLAIEVWFLTGRYTATRYNNRQAVEWPPHFARLFSALVNAWVEGGENQVERDCLLWLEALDPPEIAASSSTPRTVKSHFVPINDHRILNTKNSEDALANARGFFPDYRSKQERHFPSTTPLRDKVVFLWPKINSEYGESLRSLLGRVTRLGHSSSFVNCQLVNEVPEERWVPSNEGGITMRTVQKGALNGLIDDFRLHEGFRPRAFPFPQTTYINKSGVGRTNVAGEDSLREDWIVFAFSAQTRFLPTVRTVEIADLFRRALFHYVADPIPEFISGHESNGRPSKKGHIAFLPVPHVGSQYADGRLLGIAISVPTNAPEHDRAVLLRAVGRWEQNSENGEIRLHLSRTQDLVLERLLQLSNLVGLRRKTWFSASCEWVSATPVALPRHPGKKLGRGHSDTRRKSWQEAERIVAECCRREGLPNPSRVEVTSKPILQGTNPVRDYPSFLQLDAQRNVNIKRRLLHARITFEEPVYGPISLGSGRFLGLGLMKPVFERIGNLDDVRREF